MTTNKKDQRILKLHQSGLTPEQIARKIGNPQDTKRVLDALNRSNETHQATNETVSDLLDLLEAAIIRVEMENQAGNPILSAWKTDARAQLHEYRKQSGETSGDQTMTAPIHAAIRLIMTAADRTTETEPGIWKHRALNIVFDDQDPGASIADAIEYIEIANQAEGRAKGIEEAKAALSTLK